MYTIATVVCDASPVFTRAGQVQSPKVQRMRSKADKNRLGRCVQCLPCRRRQHGAPVLTMVKTTRSLECLLATALVCGCLVWRFAAPPVTPEWIELLRLRKENDLLLQRLKAPRHTTHHAMHHATHHATPCATPCTTHHATQHATHHPTHHAMHHAPRTTHRAPRTTHHRPRRASTSRTARP